MAINEAMRAGALGVEILISGKVPSQRGKTWRFYQGYLKKSGDVAVEGVFNAYRVAKLKTGVIGIKVSVMPSTTVLPDVIDVHEVVVEDVTGTPAAKEVEAAVEQTPEEVSEEAPAQEPTEEAAQKAEEKKE
jgi:ribosomal protein S3